MNLDTQRSKRLDAYRVDPSHEVRDEKVRVMLAGEVHTLNVFRLPIDRLFYNIRNGARPEGLEPSTYGLEIRCSIRLSYGRIY